MAQPPAPTDSDQGEKPSLGMPAGADWLNRYWKEIGALLFVFLTFAASVVYDVRAQLPYLQKQVDDLKNDQKELSRQLQTMQILDKRVISCYQKGELTGELYKFDWVILDCVPVPAKNLARPEKKSPASNP